MAEVTWEISGAYMRKRSPGEIIRTRSTCACRPWQPSTSNTSAGNPRRAFHVTLFYSLAASCPQSLIANNEECFLLNGIGPPSAALYNPPDILNHPRVAAEIHFCVVRSQIP